MSGGKYNLLLACDRSYYDQWVPTLIRSVQTWLPWLSITVVLADSDPVEEIPEVRYVYHTSPDLEEDQRIAYYQALRFLVCAELFDDDQLVMTLDVDTICTQSFYLAEWLPLAQTPHALWHDKQQNWLAGMVTFGTGRKFRQAFREALLATPLDQWIYGHDQIVLRSLVGRFSIKPISNLGKWITLGKGPGYFLTLKGRQKQRPNSVQIYQNHVVNVARHQPSPVNPDLRAVALIGPWWKGLPLPHISNIREMTLEQVKTQPLPDLWVIHNNTDNKRTKRYRECYQYITQSQRPWMVVESPAFRHNQARPDSDGVYYRWSWFSYFQHDGIHCQPDSPSDRWQQIQREQDIEIHPWRSRGDNIIWMMQRPRDSSMVPLIQRWGSYENMMLSCLRIIRMKTDRPIRIRLHPARLDQQLPWVEAVIKEIPNTQVSPHSAGSSDNWVSGGEGLYRDLDQAWAVIGGNSNSLTEAACYGIPTWCLHESAMAWPVSQRDIIDIERPNLNIPRDQWLWNLAYSQWRRDEIEAGRPWEHLMQWWPQVTQDPRLTKNQQGSNSG